MREGAHGKRPAETPAPRLWAYLTPGVAGKGGSSLDKVASVQYCRMGRVLAATLFAHESAAFDVHVPAGLGGDLLLPGLAGDVGSLARGGVLAARGGPARVVVRLGGCRGDRVR